MKFLPAINCLGQQAAVLDTQIKELVHEASTEAYIVARLSALRVMKADYLEAIHLLKGAQQEARR